MGYSVQEKAECIGTFRWIEVRLMEMLASWVPTTPEMEIKILFGKDRQINLTSPRRFGYDSGRSRSLGRAGECAYRCSVQSTRFGGRRDGIPLPDKLSHQ